MSEDSNKKEKSVSYSQYKMWMSCPHHFYLDYVLGKRVYEDSIHTAFGTSIHEPLQLYIKTLYTESAVKADEIDLYQMFKKRFEEILKEKNVKYTDDELTDFTFDGEDIIKEFTKSINRMKHFPSNKYEFVGIEEELKIPLREGINFIGYIDLILKEKMTGKYKIFDFKTSSQGWNEYQKADEKLYSQVLLYKALYSKKYNVPINMIDVEFFILKRKLLENVNFPQSRLQIFKPQDKSKQIANTLNGFAEFVNSCFNSDGSHITDINNYPKIPGNYKKNCKYCIHKKVSCDAKPTFKDDE